MVPTAPMFTPWNRLVIVVFFVLVFDAAVLGLEHECPILTFLPFTANKEPIFDVDSTVDGQYNLYSRAAVSRLSFSFAAAALMAVDHFNNRNPIVVPELATMNMTCNFTLALPRLVNSEAEGKTSVKELWDITSSSEETQPCAMLGPVNEEANFDLVSAANAFDIPLVSYYNENQLLAMKKGTLGMTLSLDGRVRAMIDYLHDRELVSVWHTATRQGTALARAMSERADEVNKAKVGEDLEISVFRDNFGENVAEKMKQMKDVGYKTIFLSVWEPSALVGYAGKLEELEMLESDYIYFLDSDLIPLDYTVELLGAQKPGSPLDKLLSGALVFDRLDGFRRYNVTDQFEQAWKNRTSEDVDRMNGIVPENTYHVAAGDYFERVSPSNYASYAYDSVMTIGLGGCLAEQEDTVDNDDRRSLQLQTREDPNKGKLLRSMQNVTFHGASGRVAFGKESGKERNAEDITIGLYNIVPNEVIDGARTFRSVLVAQYTQETGWVDIPGVKIIYRDGSLVVPEPERYYAEENHISLGVRIIGLILMSIAVMVALTSLFLLKRYEKDAVVLRAQPFFMRVLCLGSLLMSFSIFTLSWDEGGGWSTRALSVNCMLTQWFFFVGQILTFCALFTKLWRVDRVLQFRRTAVTILNVMKPTLGLLFLTLSILITWTVWDPWIWDRDEISQLPAETYGRCSCEHFWPFFGSLIGLLFLAEISTFYFAWKTADVPEDFRDSAAVMYASFAQLQSFAVGIPMLAVLGDSSVDATYFGRIFLIWIFAVSSVAVVVGPKLVKAIKLRQTPQLQNTRKRVSVTGLYTPMKNTTSNEGTSSGNKAKTSSADEPVTKMHRSIDEDGSESMSMSMGACTERIKQVAAAYAAQESGKHKF